MTKMELKPITTSVLGNMVSLGSLYDARTDSFSGLSIFESSIPHKALSLLDDDFSDYKIIHSDNFSDKFQKLDVKAELRVSVLAGLFKVQGSGQYLEDQKKSARTVRSSLLYNIKTKYENVNLYHDALRGAFSMHALQNGLATHVVNEISWGANSVLSFEYYNNDNKDIRQIEGQLSGELERFKVQIQGKADMEFKSGEILKSSNFNFRIFGDVIPNRGEHAPLTVESALELMIQMPKLVSKCNNGKGKPLVCKLVPITLLQDYLKFILKGDIILKSLMEDSLVRVVKVFEELSNLKQKVYDFFKDTEKYKKYCIGDREYDDVVSLKDEIDIQESKLKSQLATTLVDVRSGKVGHDAIGLFITEFRKVVGTLKLSPATEAYIANKIDFAKTAVEKGAKYIGNNMNLNNEILKDNDVKLFLMFFNSESYSDTEVWFQNRYIFFHELRKKSEGCKVYAVDCDIHPKLLPSGKSSCVQVVRNAQVLSNDLRLEQEQQHDGFPLVQATTGTKKVVKKPNNGIPFITPCTGENCEGSKPYAWICKKCKSQLELGLDQLVSCNCGVTPAIYLEFKCTHPKHGIAFEKHDPDYLQAILTSLMQRTELNILILGETGVGKSTWINAFVNYMKYSSLDEAKDNELITLIPSTFVVDNVKVVTGESGNEKLVGGQSATQQPKIYSFAIGPTTIHLIDTPGIGDIRGVEKDRLNFENILESLSPFKKIHAACILLNPCQTKRPIISSYCLKELLARFHLNFRENILFCFTKANTTCFSPGDPMAVLNKTFLKKSDAKIEFSDDNVFCFDSEAYRILASGKSNLPVTFTTSWNKSTQETIKMLSHIRALEPVSIATVFSPSLARKLILNLKPYLAEVSSRIETLEMDVMDARKLDNIRNELLNGRLSSKEERDLGKRKQMNDAFIAETERRIDQLKLELKDIKNAFIASASFLKTQAIIPFNDELKRYFDSLIEAERQNGGRREELARGKALNTREAEILEDTLSNATSTPVTLEEIERKVKHIKGLKHCGQTLQNILGDVFQTRATSSPVFYQDVIALTGNGALELLVRWK